MSWFYRNLIRPVLFDQDPETIHNQTISGLSRLSHSELLCEAVREFLGPEDLPTRLFGLHFPNPVGLAAGMDKHGESTPAWWALGFGFTELGAVTWHAQPGNPAPRVFRAVAEKAIVNRMGFNNPGAERLAETLQRWRDLGRWPKHPVGVNLGKSKITPLGEAVEDYANSMRVLLPHLDFFVVNVSSPNTPNLRQLQDKKALDEILAALMEVSVSGAADGLPKPVLVKVAPDLSFEALDEALETIVSRKAAGVIATNTTISRPETNNPVTKRVYEQPGGLSGSPLKSRSTEVIRHIYKATGGKLPIVGVGGVFSAADAWEKLTAGASLIQIYTSLVYEGPFVTKQIVSGLAGELHRHGLSELSEAVGLATKEC